MSAQLPHVSASVVERLQAVHELSQSAGIRRVAELEDNPFGIDLREVVGAFAFRSRTIPIVEWYNRVLGLRPEHAEQLPEILSFHRECGIRARLELTPLSLRPELGAAMAAEGMAIEQMPSVLYAAAQDRPSEASPPSAPDLEVAESPTSELELFLDVWARGFGIPEFLRDGVKQIRASWFTAPAMRRYVARRRDEVIAVGGLFTHDGCGYLCFAATLPEARNHGAQSALVRHRWQAARDLGCDLVTTQTDFGTTSQHNMERAGMRMAFSRVIALDREPE